MKQFVSLRRYEKMTVRETLVGLRTTSVAWLASLRTAGPVAACASQGRLAQLCRWLFGSLLVPLLACNFYVTESGTQGNRTFYYRRGIWRRVMAQWRRQALASAYEPVANDVAHQHMRERGFSYSYARLLPKRGGRVRAIANLGRRPTPDEATLCGQRAGYAVSINSALAPVHRVLQHETRQRFAFLSLFLLLCYDYYFCLRNVIICSNCDE